MNPENIIEINSLTDFVQAVNDINKDFGTTWFRGHENSEYTLTPSLFRNPFTCDMENDFLVHFQSKSIPYLKSSFNAKNEYEWFFLMQHFGMPTRLLDWTSSAITALAFSVFFRDDSNESGKHYEKDIDIWCLAPLKLNRLANISETTKIPSITSDDQIQGVYKTGSKVPTYPVAIFGPLNNERIVAQKGVFTLYPFSENIPKLEENEKANEFLKKITLKGQNKINLVKNELSVIGMSETSLFPDLNHLSLELRRELTQNS
ncbi:FRG domain-containing protein [Chryseobacterium sp. RLHN22]|uniref:FRG domain-containing protein n=1 Tax=Chryseobacterium sp. RLHN22 TaxID=3437885 RepID=UPI003D9AC1C8